MDASTPWRTQQLLEPKQTPRPRPPAFALRNRRPSANQAWKAETILPVAPPPYRKEVDASIVTAARSLGLDIGEVEAVTAVNEDGPAEGQRESRDEMRNRLRALEKRLGEREKELSLAAQIGQSLLSTNESLRTQHETLLQSLPPAISQTVDRLSAPAVSRAWKTDLPSTPSQFRFPSSALAQENGDRPQDLKCTLSELEIDSALTSPLELDSPTGRDTIRGLPRRPPLSTFASSSSSSSHARSHSYARLQLQDLAEQNHTLLSRLTEVEEEDEARRRKMRKLETEIGRLRAELEKAEERREVESAEQSSLGMGFAGNAALCEPAKPLWQRHDKQTKKADQENIPVLEPTLHITTVDPIVDFSSGTPEPQPILRRSRRQNTDLPDERPIVAPSRLANEKSKAELTEADGVLNRASMLRSVSRHRSSSSMNSTSSSPSSIRGSGNRQMIESQRKVRKKVSQSSFLGADVHGLPHVDQSGEQDSSSTRPTKLNSLASPATSTLRQSIDSPARTRRGSTLSPSDSPQNSIRSHLLDSLGHSEAHCRTLGSELGSEFGDDLGQGLPGLELIGHGTMSSAESIASPSKLEVSASLAVSALAVALEPASALVLDSSTPILPHGAFKQDGPMDSRTFDLLDQAVCERSMRWADDEKDAEDEMSFLDASDEDYPDEEHWALTRYKPVRARSSEKALVKRSRSTRPLPRPTRPHGAPFGLLGWGQTSDPWESTLYSEDDGALTPPRRSRSYSRRSFAPPTQWSGMAVEDDPLSTSLSVRVRHSRSLSVARIDPATLARSPEEKPVRSLSRRSLPERVVTKAIGILMDVWIFMQFIVVVGVFLWVTLRKGPRAILGAETVEKRIGRT